MEEKVDVLKAVRQLVDQLTTVVGDQMASPPIRVAQSWSSEYLDSRAQAQTFLILSLTAASVHDQTVVEEFLVHARALFLGWQRLCQRSKHQQQTCQVVTDGGGWGSLGTGGAGISRDLQPRRPRWRRHD